MTSAYKRPPYAQALPYNSPELSNKSKICGSPPCSEQVHIQLGGPEEMVISFASDPTADTEAEVSFGCSAEHLEWKASGDTKVYSQLYYWADELWDPRLKGGFELTAGEVAEIQSTSDWAFYDHTPDRHFPSGIWKNVTAEDVNSGSQNGLGKYFNPKENYDSPAIHTVVLSGLIDGATYFFKVDNDEATYSFTMPKSGSEYPFLVGLMSDVGQTEVSKTTMDMLQAMSPQVILLSGDLSYADGYYHRWDSYGRLVEPLAATTPIMTCVGNHEVSDGEAYQSYTYRYPMPYKASGSIDPNIWSRDIGPMHVISLNSYAQSGNTSYQAKWLQKDLKTRFKRKQTPWLVVLMHVPFYNSNAGHLGEAKIMMDNFEDLLYQYGVNLVINGHVHSFERTWPTYKNVTDACGPSYLNVGDAGNREGPYNSWLPGEGSEPSPVWSAFRQGSFGFGDLEFVNDTHVLFRWTRNACFDPSDGTANYAKKCSTPGDIGPDAAISADNSWIVRAQSCHNQA
eukprot:CAMPEP_0197631084 /NCGR_PEP_ID=MMETSP1338-20131121/8374_1 /TAXON_ID=43686 ORGANISM="Pelagodinium beii, Strain RCC1491" /NCGR_SAMPLE_ID=MMETSP1338 /ASSEMBLY_ACC=CAM_ASM_000754 /LENGTH=510 /DNA_ID=CAMNT_0043202473 /DNA_START=33 /DNA_END=1565 /DNA_ORIENTATION=-